MSNSKRMIYSRNVLSNDFIEYYNKEKLKYSKVHTAKVNKDIVRDVIKSICKELNYQIINSEGGVLMNNWGYFFIQRSFGKVLHYKDKKLRDELELDFRYNGFKYNLVFLPKLEGVKSFFGWSFDYTFTKDTVRQVYKNLNKGYRYKAFPFTLIRLKLI